MNRSKLDFSLLGVGYGCEKAVTKKKETRKKLKMKLKGSSSDHCSKPTFPRKRKPRKEFRLYKITNIL